MVKRVLAIAALTTAVFTARASAQFAQQTGRLSVEPYAAYGFFGELPETGRELDAAVGYGGRVAYKFSPQFSLFGNYQRAQPELAGTSVTVDHWSAGVEFDFAPRGGAEGLIPVLLEAGVGQVRYDDLPGRGDASDIAANIGIGSAFRLSPNFAIRYGVNDYISNYNEDGIANHVFARIGAELRF